MICISFIQLYAAAVPPVDQHTDTLARDNGAGGAVAASVDYRLKNYEDGIRVIHRVSDMDEWIKKVDALKTCHWALRASDSFGSSQQDWSTDIDVEALKKILMGMCSSVVTMATGAAGIDIIVSLIGQATDCLISVVKNGDDGKLTFTGSVGSEKAVKHAVVGDKYGKYAAGYFLSFERTSSSNSSPLHKSKDAHIKWAGRFDFFEILSQERKEIPGPVIPAISEDPYDWLPQGSKTHVYVALIDHRFDRGPFPPDGGHAGWCQIVDTCDAHGDVVYSMRHFVRNASGTSYGLWSAQPAQAEIEILIGSKYQHLQHSKKIGREVTTPEIHSNRVSPTFMNDTIQALQGRDINRYEHWMKRAIIGMEMPEALTCQKVIETIKNMIKFPVQSRDTTRSNVATDPLWYCLYGCRFFSKAMNCIPWPFLFWERILPSQPVCNNSMREYLDFKVRASYCKIEDGFSAFFDAKSGKLINKNMRLAQMELGGGRIHRIWQREGREDDTVSIVGGDLVAFSFGWASKFADHTVEKYINISNRSAECFI